MSLPPHEASPTGIVESAQDHRKDNDIGNIVGSVAGKTSMDQIVIIERVEEIKPLHINEEICTQSEVARGR